VPVVVCKPVAPEATVEVEGYMSAAPEETYKPVAVVYTSAAPEAVNKPVIPAAVVVAVVRIVVVQAVHTVVVSFVVPASVYKPVVPAAAVVAVVRIVVVQAAAHTVAAAVACIAAAPVVEYMVAGSEEYTVVPENSDQIHYSYCHAPTEHKT